MHFKKITNIVHQITVKCVKKHEIENRPHLDNQRRCRKNFIGFELLGLKVKAKI